MQELTRRQREILDFIKGWVRERGYPPSVREIGEAVGLKSTSTVHTYLAQLERKGYIRRDPTKPRAIEILDEANVRTRTVPVPLVGQVTAGQPILAVENIEDILPLPADLVPEGEVFALRIRGDSMIGAGILDGDYVIVRRQDTAQNGDIVVALLEDEATVKRFYQERDGIRLQPENPAMEPIRVRHARVLGKVVALLRRMG
ncbi:SOS-response transcriptional repressor, LexA [Thermaerobacter marianensis DSM 12885]|uniref:LexA repressor n=1 Tax=Thermaerobacter marianensis (strain ATCC 700841 / DSM 12885 / JCM 10246 / 7p75a) TaxID=644966 RepID=E6SK55_THEM7|nr:transcriptional repressor LexA [Thermaerobacter marianensis]ADU51196.1 SOS-response transcriptional repressor, LexA [Thermaerobacter marianensis DSM 12885]